MNIYAKRCVVYMHHRHVASCIVEKKDFFSKTVLSPGRKSNAKTLMARYVK
jgi:hypothetical protein